MDFTNLSDQTYHSIVTNLSRIRSHEFERRDVKELIFTMRGLLDSEEELIELADTIAHVDLKDKGLIHSHVDYVYAVYTIIEKSTLAKSKYDISSFQPRLFKTILNGMDLYSDPYFKNVCGMSIETAIAFVKHQYIKNANGEYVLKDLKQFDVVQRIFALILSESFPYSLPISFEKLVEQLNNVISRFIELYNLDSEYQRNIIQINQEEIALCLLSIFHGIRFKLYDEEFAITYISSNDTQLFEAGISSKFYRLSIYAKIPIKSFPGGVTFPVFRSPLICSKYILESIPEFTFLENLPFDVKRNSNGRLYFTN